MKIRQGFVSNSSSSSFIMVGYEMDVDELFEMFFDSNPEILEFYTKNCEFLRDELNYQGDLFSHGDEDDDAIYESIISLPLNFKQAFLMEYAASDLDIELVKITDKKKMFLGEKVGSFSDDSFGDEIGPINVMDTKTTIDDMFIIDDSRDIKIFIGYDE